jgi:hypothetical protein
VAANHLLWPGLGTALAKRKIGLVQMGISGAGGVMAIIGVVGFCSRWINELERPGWRDQYALTALCGVALFGLTWLWAVFNSISILLAVKAPSASPPPKIEE